MMKSLKQRMLNDIESTRGMATKMAKLAGYATANKFTTMLKKEDGDIEKFDGFVRVVHEMYPDEKFKYMKEFAETLNPNTITARFMLEYLTLYKIAEDKKKLLGLMLNASNEESKEWAFVYQIDDKLINGEIDAEDAIYKLVTKGYITNEMKVFSKIVQFYAHLDKQNINTLKSIHQEILDIIDEIKQEFSRNSFKARFFAINSRVNLLNGNSSIKNDIFLVINALDPIKANNFLQYANSHMFNDYDKVKEYLDIADSYALDNPTIQKEIVKSRNFAAIYYKDFSSYTKDGDYSNELYYYCMKKDVKLAENILEKIEFDKLTDYQKAFNCYYRGLLYGDEKLLCKSISYFNGCGDKYYKRLAVEELGNLGVKEFYLEALVS